MSDEADFKKELIERNAKLQERRAKEHLPKGGVYYYAPSVAVADALIEIRIRVAEILQIPLENVAVNPVMTPKGDLFPSVDVALPKTMVSGPMNRKEVELMYDKTIRGAVAAASDGWDKTLAHRLEVFLCGRKQKNG